MDLNQDGVIAIDEFLDCCVRDEALVRSMGVFDSSFWRSADGHRRKRRVTAVNP